MLSKFRTVTAVMVALLVVAMAAPMAGCATGEPTSTGSEDTATATTSVLDKVVKDGKIRIAVFSDVPPMGFLDDNQELQGIDVDVAKEMAAALGDVEIEFVPTTNANRIPYLQSDKVDCVIASFTMNSEPPGC